MKEHYHCATCGKVIRNVEEKVHRYCDPCLQEVYRKAK